MTLHEFHSMFKDSCYYSAGVAAHHAQCGSLWEVRQETGCVRNVTKYDAYETLERNSVCILCIESQISSCDSHSRSFPCNLTAHLLANSWRLAPVSSLGSKNSRLLIGAFGPRFADSLSSASLAPLKGLWKARGHWTSAMIIFEGVLLNESTGLYKCLHLWYLSGECFLFLGLVWNNTCTTVILNLFSHNGKLKPSATNNQPLHPCIAW